MRNFIEKLEALNLFLVEKDGEISLKKYINRPTIPYDFKKDKDHIIPFIKNNKAALVEFLKEHKNVNESTNVVYRLSPLQEGILFEGLYNQESSMYTVQIKIDIID